jgi:uroporphyrinogen III methyltransferase/synthase
MGGKVWLVGAGPSDIGLLTVKGKEILQSAEVVVYDALVSPEILSLIPPEAEKINAGKRARHHIKCQEETNQILLDRAQDGKRVVRLKGGDPFLFGRGGEELELLAEHNIPYEVVPGVTSAISVPAYNGIPVTHRDFCSSVHIITGHKKKDAPLDINFKALTEVGGTLIFLMGIGALPDICAGLIAGGMNPDTPAAVLQKGTTAEQKAVVADIRTLPEKAAAAQIQMPAIIVVGGVCKLHDRFAWAEKLPLFGCRLVVTRPRDRATTLSRRLRKLGAQVIEIPAIRTVPIENNFSLIAALNNINMYDWLVFTSPAGVTVFLNAMRAQKMDIRALAGVKIAVLGKGTGAELEKCGVFPDLMPATYDGESLGIALQNVVAPGQHILIPRARMGSTALVSEIKKVPDVIVDDLPTYDTVFEQSTVIDEGREFTDHPQTMAVFTSASTVRGFVEATKGLDYSDLRAICIGKQTAAEASKHGMQIYTATRATLDALIELVIQVFTAQKEDK